MTPATRKPAGPVAEPAAPVPTEVAVTGGADPDGDLLALGVGRAGTRRSALVTRLAARYAVHLDEVIPAEGFTGRPGEVLRVPVPAPDGLPARLYLIGTGSGTPADLRRAGAALARTARGRTALTAALDTGPGTPGARAATEGLLLGGYTPPARGQRDRAGAAPVGRAALLGAVPDPAVTRGVRHARATLQARDLANIPSDVKGPAWMVERARQAATDGGLDLDVWDADRLAAEGFGGLLAVGGGSPRPPALVRLDYQPDGSAGRRPIVLIGKGVTFDTGGLSIKPREAMVPMKTDMAGSAAVLAVLAACRDLGVRRPVTGLLPLAENAVSGAAYRPGDVLTQYGGRTVEIANTDAEGRIVLADALAYADTALDPDTVIDIATLTGAATFGLGRGHAALFTGDDRLARGLQEAGVDAGEQVWRMPLAEEYRPAIRSGIADLRHVPTDGKVGGGAITAALFLREFTGGRRWAHLDIAGPGRADKDDHEITRGATGFGARLLLRWLETLR
ncbi:MAG: leucyl aminopeptidase family protein [Kineosporiaceae bacterium]